MNLSNHIFHNQKNQKYVSYEALLNSLYYDKILVIYSELVKYIFQASTQIKSNMTYR